MKRKEKQRKEKKRKEKKRKEKKRKEKKRKEKKRKEKKRKEKKRKEKKRKNKQAAKHSLHQLRKRKHEAWMAVSLPPPPITLFLCIVWISICYDLLMCNNIDMQ